MRNRLSGPAGPLSSAPTEASARRSPLTAAAAAFYGGSAAVALACLLAAVLTTGRGHVAVSIYLGATVFAGAAAVFSFLAGRDQSLSPRCRRAWRWILLGMLLRLAGMSVDPAVGWSAIATYPHPGELLRLLAFPALLCGLLTVPRRHVGRPELQKLVLDAVTLSFGGCLIIWYFVVGPHQPQGHSTAAVTAALVVPLVDLVMVFVAVAVLRRCAERATRFPLYLLAFGWAWEVVDSPYVAHLRLTGRMGYTFPAWVFVVWLVANFLWAAAAFEQNRWSSHRSDTVGPTAAFERLPYLGIVMGLGVLIIATVRVPGGFPGVVTFGVIVLTVLVLMRQNVVLRENRRMAETDPLTGLANRSRLGSELDDALAQARRSGCRVGVLLADLDDFKSINDRLGHAAGDQALREFAGMLRHAVHGHDLVGRLGGDEFAVILPDIASAANAEKVAHRIHAQAATPISVRGGRLLLRASVGVAVSQGSEPDSDGLMHRADVAMYEAKRLGRGHPLEFAEPGSDFRPL